MLSFFSKIELNQNHVERVYALVFKTKIDVKVLD